MKRATQTDKGGEAVASTGMLEVPALVDEVDDATDGETPVALEVDVPLGVFDVSVRVRRAKSQRNTARKTSK